MKIIVLEGSPNQRGSSNLLAGQFIRGAEEAGHTVSAVDIPRAGIHPCTGCVRCGYEGPCVQKDGMEPLREKILSSDMLVFVTPLYYYGMSAQLKAAVDRFCSFNSSLTAKGCAPLSSPPHGTVTAGRSMSSPPTTGPWSVTFPSGIRA